MIVIEKRSSRLPRDEEARRGKILIRKKEIEEEGGGVIGIYVIGGK